MTKCSVPGCKSGYKSCKEKRSVFCCPKSEEMRTVWSRAFPRRNYEFTKNSRICELHFEPRFILRSFSHVINGKEVLTPRAVPRLLDDAIPTIFPKKTLLNVPLKKSLPEKTQSEKLRQSSRLIMKRQSREQQNRPTMMNRIPRNTGNNNQKRNKRKLYAVETRSSSTQNDKNIKIRKIRQLSIEKMSSFKNGLNMRQLNPEKRLKTPSRNDGNNNDNEISKTMTEVTVSLIKIRNDERQNVRRLTNAEITNSDNDKQLNPEKTVKLSQNNGNDDEIQNKEQTITEVNVSTNSRRNDKKQDNVKFKRLPNAEKNDFRNENKQSDTTKKPEEIDLKVTSNNRDNDERPEMSKTTSSSSNHVSGEPFSSETVFERINSNEIYDRTNSFDVMSKAVNVSDTNSVVFQRMTPLYVMTHRTCTPFCDRPMPGPSVIEIRTKERLSNTRHRLSICRRNNLRLKKELGELKAENSSLKNMALNVRDILEGLPPTQRLMVKEAIMLSKQGGRKNGFRYSNEWLFQCALLNLRSNTNYDYMRLNDILPLPSRRASQKYLKNLKEINFGFDTDVFTILSDKLKHVSSIRSRRGCIVFDELEVREQLEDGTIIGEDRFNGDRLLRYDDELRGGDRALVFYFRSFMGGWSHTLGTFRTICGTPGAVLEKLLMECIKMAENANALIDAVVCDGSTNNESLMKSLVLSGKLNGLKTKFPHPCDKSRDVFFVFDSPYIFKCIRDDFIKAKTFKFPYGEAMYGHYGTLLEHDQKLPESLRKVPKLTKAHVWPNHYEKTNVQLSIQLFSNSVCAGLRHYEALNVPELQTCRATIDFTRIMNAAFDALNSKHQLDSIRMDSANYKVIKDTITWLNDWETYIQKHPKDTKFFLSAQTSKRLRLTLESVVKLSERLISEGFDYVLTATMNQYPLEPTITSE